MLQNQILNYWTQKFNGATQVKIVSRINQDVKGRYLNFFIEDDTLKYPHQRIQYLVSRQRMIFF